MRTNQHIEKVVSDFIMQLEEIGDKSGGSGHMSNISIDIQNIDIKETPDHSSHSYKVTATFFKTTETEFTYYPDNPPLEEEYTQEFYLGQDFVIKGFANKNLEKSNVDIDLMLGLDDENNNREEMRD